MLRWLVGRWCTFPGETTIVQLRNELDDRTELLVASCWLYAAAARTAKSDASRNRTHALIVAADPGSEKQPHG